MSRIIAFTFFLLLLAAVAFFTLQHMQPIADSNADTPITGTDWRPVSIGNREVPADARLLLRFEIDGRLHGDGGCNRFFGSYTLHGTDIHIGSIGATRMACPEPQMNLETEFLETLEHAEKIDIRGDRLLLSDGAGTELLVLQSVVPASAERP